jgi:hypothetical protein
VYESAAPSVVVISATANVHVPATFFTPPSSEKVQIVVSVLTYSDIGI